MRRHPRGTGLAGKSASIQPPQPPSEERGVELIGGKAIPFVRNLVSADYWTVTYGSHDAGDACACAKREDPRQVRTVHGTTRLMGHVRRGTSTWSVAHDGNHAFGGRVTNRLQGIVDTAAGDHLIGLVDILSHKPLTLDDPSDPGRSWALLCYRIREADEAELNRLVSQ